jgi:hypothetical protein
MRNSTIWGHVCCADTASNAAMAAVILPCRNACSSAVSGSPSLRSAASTSNSCSSATCFASLPSRLSLCTCSSLCLSCVGCASANNLMTCGRCEERVVSTTNNALSTPPTHTRLWRLERLRHRRLDGKLHAAQRVHKRHVTRLHVLCGRTPTWVRGAQLHRATATPVNNHTRQRTIILVRLALNSCSCFSVSARVPSYSSSSKSCCFATSHVLCHACARSPSRCVCLCVCIGGAATHVSHGVQVFQLRHEAGHLLLRILPQLRGLKRARVHGRARSKWDGVGYNGYLGSGAQKRSSHVSSVVTKLGRSVPLPSSSRCRRRRWAEARLASQYTARSGTPLLAWPHLHTSSPWLPRRSSSSSSNRCAFS